MAYVKDQMIARRGYSGFGDDTTPWWEKLLGGTVAGAAQTQAAQTQSAADVQRAIAAQGQGIGVGDIALLGAIGLGAYLLLKKKRRK